MVLQPWISALRLGLASQRLSSSTRRQAGGFYSSVLLTPLVRDHWQLDVCKGFALTSSAEARSLMVHQPPLRYSSGGRFPPVCSRHSVPPTPVGMPSAFFQQLQGELRSVHVFSM
jgi:hypothetical protein